MATNVIELDIVSPQQVERTLVNKIQKNLNMNRNGKVTTQVMSKDGSSITRFTYQVKPSSGTIVFDNLMIDDKLRGMGVMGRIFDRVEMDALRKGFKQIKIANFENIPLAYYFASKRGYTLYSADDEVISNEGIRTLGTFIPQLRGEPKNAATMMSRMKTIRTMRKAGVDPFYAVKTISSTN